MLICLCGLGVYLATKQRLLKDEGSEGKNNEFTVSANKVNQEWYTVKWAQIKVELFELAAKSQRIRTVQNL